jgi:hypothetical protein
MLPQYPAPLYFLECRMIYRTTHVDPSRPNPSPLVGLAQTFAPALLVALVVFALGVLLESFMLQGRASLRMEVLDNAVVGVLAGSIVLWYEQQRRRAVQERLKLVKEMARHIGEAAHIIEYFVRHTGTADLDGNVANSLQRIHWALQELGPGAPLPPPSVIEPPQPEPETTRVH